MPMLVFGQWIENGGPSGYTIRAIAILQNGKDVFVAGNGVFHSSDFGTSWKAINEGLKNQFESVTSFAYNDNYIFMGTFYNGLYYSTNFGSSWIQTNLDSIDVLSIAINVDTLFVGTLGHGIFYSTDYGSHWDSLNVGLTNKNVSKIILHGTTLYAGTIGGGVFRSTNSGAIWISANFGLGNLNVWDLINYDTLLFLATSGGVFRSSDYGNSWNNAGLDSVIVYDIDLNESILYAATNKGLYYSINEGNNWEIVDTLISFYCSSIATDGDYLYIGAGNFRGLYRSTNKGSSWDVSNLLFMYVYSLISDGQTTLVGTTGHISISTDCGISWKTPLSSGLPEDSWIGHIVIKGDKFFASTYKNIYRSSDNGVHWIAIGTGLESSPIGALNVIGNNLLAGTNTGVFISNNDGDSWLKINNGLPQNDYVNSFVECDSIIFAATENNGVYKLSPNDSAWVSINTGLKNLNITTLTSIKPYIFAGTKYSGVFRLDISDTIWTEINSGIHNPEIHDLVNDGVNLFACTRYTGIDFSSNFGENWKSINEGLPSMTEVTSLGVCGPYLLAGTNKSLWKRPLSEIITTVAQNTNVLHNDYFLSQNYPNPFNPSTTIEFTLPHSGNTELKIYNLFGQEIVTLINSFLPSGKNRIIWNAENISSGVYFYRLTSGKYSQIKKILLVR